MLAPAYLTITTHLHTDELIAHFSQRGKVTRLGSQSQKSRGKFYLQSLDFLNLPPHIPFLSSRTTHGSETMRTVGLYIWGPQVHPAQAWLPRVGTTPVTKVRNFRGTEETLRTKAVLQMGLPGNRCSVASWVTVA